MANEYDLGVNNGLDDWHRLATLLRDEDHVGHWMSIHNWMEAWDASSEWVTHCSIQHGDNLAVNVDKGRRLWGKPVVVDETGYEGDLDQGWGNLTGQGRHRRSERSRRDCYGDGATVYVHRAHLDMGWECVNWRSDGAS